MPNKTPSIHAPLQPINGQPSGLVPVKNSLRKAVIWAIAALGAMIVGVSLATVIWYNVQLTPRTDDKQQSVLVTIELGTAPGAIGQLLEEKAIIRSRLAFGIYSRLSGAWNNLQAGTYSFLPSDSTPQIVKDLVDGNVHTKEITFYPGATLAEHRQVLLDAGFDQTEIDVAFAKTYDSPLFATKPSGTDLEGYIYGETYNFNSGTTVETVLQRTFNEFYTDIVDNNLVEGFRLQGLTLYEGITLASIIQREVSGEADQKQVAQVFFARLRSGMQLGSDVTFIYAAEKLDIIPTSTLDSPYNTRISIGLPPGPISSPGLSALLAVADPAGGDYLYFLSGDNDTTYFSITEAEHQANIRDHCQVKCSTLL
jgi:UPF0755 protein